ncbi:MAG TPA: ACT domain-containing protein [Thermoleophilaceae bacterium]|nr:ACT domain-containing protein [Thermoleophilaceae bacterium]
MARFALSAIGRDRPGIVAGVSGVLLRHGANIEDSRMAILGGHFTMMLIVSTAPGANVETLRGDLDSERNELGLGAATLEEVSDEHGFTRPEPSHVVTVYGADHAGIVHAVTRALADMGVNVLDVATHLAEEEGEEAIYAMFMELDLPEAVGGDRLESELRAVADREQLDLTIRAVDAEAL